METSSYSRGYKSALNRIKIGIGWIFFLLFTPLYADAQIKNAAAKAPCFDVDEVFEHCEIGSMLYLRVNFHFFYHDSLRHKVQVVNLSPDEAVALADRMVTEGNGEISRISPQWKSPYTDTACCPIRFVLCGVYFHHQPAANGSAVTTLQKQYGVNTDSEINIYMANYPGTANGMGVSSIAAASVDLDWAPNLLHELGHVLDLAHTFSNDGCDDTPVIYPAWDQDCDGKPDKKVHCWTFDMYEKADKNQNGIPDCQDTAFCAPHPCCDWGNYDNNIMGYGGYKGALTPCQIKKMLLHIAQKKCNYIASTGVCAPPRAFIAPSDSCAQCFQLAASFHEVAYRIDVFAADQASRKPVWSSDWIAGEAGRFCLPVTGKRRKNIVKPNQRYRLSLTVANACEETHTATFDWTSKSCP